MKLRKLIGAIAAAGLASCAAAAPQKAPEAKPALWKLADEDTTIYLFGTIHMLPEGVKWRSAALDRAIKASDTLVIETLINKDPMGAATTMMKLGVTPGLPPLVERVPEEKRAQLKTLAEWAGVPLAALDRMETWAAGLTLLATAVQKLGIDPSRGVEMIIAKDYEGKPIEGLETVEQQFGLFDSLSEESQRKFLAGVIDSPEQIRREFDGMLGAWSKGDERRMAATFDSETALSPELREVLMKKRNEAWAAWLAKRLEKPGTVMVAVGAGHLAGRDSVQSLLRKHGLKTERVQ